MFFPVRIFKANGKVKKEISSELLSKRYWKEFDEAVRTNIQINPKGRVKRTADQFYEPQYDQSFYSED